MDFTLTLYVDGPLNTTITIRALDATLDQLETAVSIARQNMSLTVPDSTNDNKPEENGTQATYRSRGNRHWYGDGCNANNSDLLIKDHNTVMARRVFPKPPASADTTYIYLVTNLESGRPIGTFTSLAKAEQWVAKRNNPEEWEVRTTILDFAS